MVSILWLVASGPVPAAPEGMLHLARRALGGGVPSEWLPSIWSSLPISGIAVTPIVTSAAVVAIIAIDAPAASPAAYTAGGTYPSDECGR